MFEVRSDFLAGVGPAAYRRIAMSVRAWVATGAKQKLVQQTVDLGPLGAEQVEIAVESCGLCHSDLSMLNNEWGMSEYPAIFGHEVVGRISTVGAAAKG